LYREHRRRGRTDAVPQPERRSGLGGIGHPGRPLGTIVAWELVNTVYALKYARMYFLDHREGGFDVKQETQPTYSDFAYFAFTVGMSYAAPEVEPINGEIRRKALLHALLSYFFGTVLIAVAINLVTDLGQR
jgi:uncharacterized membrane protein